MSRVLHQLLYLVRLLSLMAAFALPSLANAATCSTAFCTLDLNSTIWVNNNTWGSESSPSGWWESITTNSSNSFRIDFNWPSGSNNNSVKAYPSAVLGWHWGWRFQGTGLPSQLSANRNINTSYAYTASFGGGTRKLHGGSARWRNSPLSRKHLADPHTIAVRLEVRSQPITRAHRGPPCGAEQ